MNRNPLGSYGFEMRISAVVQFLPIFSFGANEDGKIRVKANQEPYGDIMSVSDFFI